MDVVQGSTRQLANQMCEQVRHKSFKQHLPSPPNLRNTARTPMNHRYHLNRFPDKACPVAPFLQLIAITAVSGCVRRVESRVWGGITFLPRGMSIACLSSVIRTLPEQVRIVQGFSYFCAARKIIAGFCASFVKYESIEEGSYR